MMHTPPPQQQQLVITIDGTVVDYFHGTVPSSNHIRITMGCRFRVTTTSTTMTTTTTRSFSPPESMPRDSYGRSKPYTIPLRTFVWACSPAFGTTGVSNPPSTGSSWGSPSSGTGPDTSLKSPCGIDNRIGTISSPPRNKRRISRPLPVRIVVPPFSLPKHESSSLRATPGLGDWDASVAGPGGRTISSWTGTVSSKMWEKWMITLNTNDRWTLSVAPNDASY